MQEAVLQPPPQPYHPHHGASVLSPNPVNNGGDLFNGCYYSPFTSSTMGPSPRSTLLAPSSQSSSDSSVDDGKGDGLVATEHRLYLTRLALQYQETTNRFRLCLAHFADATAEAEALRLENAELRAANNGMAGRIAMLGGRQCSSIALADDFHRLHLAGVQTSTPMPAPQTTPVSQAQKHAALPKSISIRSTGYLKMIKSGSKHRVSKPVDVGAQRVFVGVNAANPEEQKDVEISKDQATASGLEFEVYNQGMYKTELCNKWEETGECPYGDQCQFAHGIAELRPIIRHPRYKTQVCRMVLGGYLCPYGHRCHFLHTLPMAPAPGLPCP